MNVKTVFFFLLIALLSLAHTEYDVFASDAEYAFCDDWEEIETLVSETKTASGSALVVNALYLNHQELCSVNNELKIVSALLLILVAFETLRIVRSWSKGIGVK